MKTRPGRYLPENEPDQQRERSKSMKTIIMAQKKGSTADTAHEWTARAAAGKGNAAHLYYISTGGNDLIIAETPAGKYSCIGEQDFYRDFERQGINYLEEPVKALQAIEDISSWAPISTVQARYILQSRDVIARIRKCLP